jgi:hypothetical protein
LQAILLCCTEIAKHNKFINPSGKFRSVPIATKIWIAETALNIKAEGGDAEKNFKSLMVRRYFARYGYEYMRNHDPPLQNAISFVGRVIKNYEAGDFMAIKAPASRFRATSSTVSSRVKVNHLF